MRNKLVLGIFAVVLFSGVASANIVFDHAGDVEFKTDLNLSQNSVDGVNKLEAENVQAMRQTIDVNESLGEDYRDVVGLVALISFVNDDLDTDFTDKMSRNVLESTYFGENLDYKQLHQLRRLISENHKLDNLPSSYELRPAMVDPKGNLITWRNLSSFSSEALMIDDGLKVKEQFQSQSAIESRGEVSRVQPFNETHEAIYASSTSPKEKIVITGSATLTGTEETVAMPIHFSRLASGNINVQVTPRTAETTGLAVTEASKFSFDVEELGSGTDNDVDFDYRVSAERNGTQGRQVIRRFNEVAEVPPPALSDELSRPTDPDGDGLYEDIRGDGDFTILDVQALFNNLESPEVQRNAKAFSFHENKKDSINIRDVKSLFNELEE